MKRKILRQLLKKSIAFTMAVVMMFTCVGVMAPTQVKASEYVFEEDFEGNCDRWTYINKGKIMQDPYDSNNHVMQMGSASNGWGRAEYYMNLKPNTSYLLEARVRGDNISLRDEYSDGVFIDVDGSKAYPLDYIDVFKGENFDWTTMQVYFYTSSRGEITLRCGIGDMCGDAYFDDIRIKEYTYTEADEDKRIIGETENIRLSLTPETMKNSGISDEKYQQFLDDLQATYKAYYNLTGSAPYYGDKINMIESFQPAWQRYGAIAGNSVILCGSQVNALKTYMETGTVNFGWLHELGHDFDNISNIETGEHKNLGWDFHDEFWANTKMLYVLDTTNVKTTIDGLNAGSLDEILEHYKKNYDKWLADDIWNDSEQGDFNDSYHDALTYIFGTIIQDIGWEPFIKTFHQYTAGEIPTPSTRLAKLERFLYGVQQNYNPDGNEVLSHFKNDEYGAVYSYYYNLEKSENTDLDSKRWLADEELLSLIGNKQFPEVVQAVIDREKKHILCAGSQEELDDIIENVKMVVGSVTVSYQDYDGKVIAVETLDSGDEIPLNIIPNGREYYTFNGWYMDKECTVPVSQEAMNTLEKEITVYAGWTLNTYTINYQLNGGTNSDLNIETFTAEDSLIVLETPEREGYIFEGWYRNSDFTKRIYDFEPQDFSSSVLENFTVYAKWKEKTAEPTITKEPTATPEPPVTKAPTVTPEPPITKAPTATPKPPVTKAPTATPEPLVTKAPTATPEPPVTKAPTATPEITVEPTKVVTPTVVPKKVSIKKANVAKVSTQYYYGKALKPNVKVTYQGKTLKKNTDYKLTYKSNKKAGTGKITITGNGNYTGTKTVTFKIVNGYATYKVTSKTVLYKSASGKSKKLITLSKGKKVKAYVDSEVKDGKKKNWIKVKVGNKTGYVLKKKLKKVK